MHIHLNCQKSSALRLLVPEELVQENTMTIFAALTCRFSIENKPHTETISRHVSAFSFSSGAVFRPRAAEYENKSDGYCRLLLPEEAIQLTASESFLNL